MRAFVQDYFSQVTSDPESTFEMLTPEFQAETGGFERYSGFWSTISRRRPTTSGLTRGPSDVLHDRLRHDLWSDHDRAGALQLQRGGDRFLIAGEG